MIKNITIVSCHSREGGNLDTCFRRYDTKFVSPNSIGFTIYNLYFYVIRLNPLYYKGLVGKFCYLRAIFRLFFYLNTIN
ncbi:hypothetical protein [Candidatus Tisiphia endosymbiont of Hybos culiciformis]|uniref:hypothetical protein n=1 Tax=Candidatus Tisiphia endosymbiont of Hybos culiciformis TaxID=3139331 RepID=UPI003CCB30B0